MLSKKLRSLREQSQLNQTEFAEKFGLSSVRYNQYETGKRNPDYETLKKFANFFEVSVDYLLGNSDIKKTDNINSESKKSIKIPVLGSVATGIPIEAVEDIIDYEEISNDMALTGEFFALQIKGESMEPKFSNGDVVIVKQQHNFENGDIAVVLVNGSDATVKKVVRQDDGIMLIATNTAIFEPVFYSKKQIKDLPVIILGKVVELRAKF